jgi:hypothetical protein
MYNLTMKPTTHLRPQAIIFIIFLLIQYLLGMLSNLYAKFPGNDMNWKYATSHALIILHIIVGTLLMVSMIVLFIRAARSKDRLWKLCSGISFAAIVLAMISGTAYISAQNELYSLIMSIMFVVALASISIALYKTK